MKINPNSKNAIKQFKHIKHLSISGNKDDGFLDLFLLPINLLLITPYHGRLEINIKIR